MGRVGPATGRAGDELVAGGHHTPESDPPVESPILGAEGAPRAEPGAGRAADAGRRVQDDTLGDAVQTTRVGLERERPRADAVATGAHAESAKRAPVGAAVGGRS